MNDNLPAVSEIVASDSLCLKYQQQVVDFGKPRWSKDGLLHRQTAAQKLMFGLLSPLECREFVAVLLHIARLAGVPRVVNKGKWQEEMTATNSRRGGWVYLVGGSGFYKIGLTANLEARIATLRTNVPFEVQLIHSIPCEDVCSLEKHWHRRFADKRLQGEWFALSAPDLDEFRSFEQEGMAQK